MTRAEYRSGVPMLAMEPHNAVAVNSAEATIDAEAVIDAVALLERNRMMSPVAKAWREHAVQHLWTRLDKDLRAGQERPAAPAPDALVLVVALDELKTAAAALDEAAYALKEKAHLPMPANRAHQAAQHAAKVLQELMESTA